MTTPTPRFVPSLLATALWLGCGTAAPAQELPGAETPLRTEAATAVPEITPREMLDEVPLGPTPEPVQPLEYLPVDKRTWELNPRLAVTWQHDTNVFLAPENEVVADAWTVSPGIHYHHGDGSAPLCLNFDYQADLTFYDGLSGQDTDNHYLVTSLIYQMAKLRMTLSAQLLRYTGGDFDAGGQSQRLQILPMMEVRYSITQKTDVGVYGDMLRSDYDAYLDASRYRAGLFVDYRVTEVSRWGLQANELWEDVDGTGSQTAQEILLRMDYGRDSRFTVFGHAGVEIREPADTDDVVTPVGRVGMAYSPWDTFRLSLDVYRTATPSVSLDGQYFYATGVLVRASQRFLDRFTIGLDWGYESTHYKSALSSVTASREDDISLLRPWVRYSFTDWAALEFYYQRTKDDSSGENAQPFDREQTGVGLNMSW